MARQGRKMVRGVFVSALTSELGDDEVLQIAKVSNTR